MSSTEGKTGKNIFFKKSFFLFKETFFISLPSFFLDFFSPDFFPYVGFLRFFKNADEMQDVNKYIKAYRSTPLPPVQNYKRITKIKPSLLPSTADGRKGIIFSVDKKMKKNCIFFSVQDPSRPSGRL